MYYSPSFSDDSNELIELILHDKPFKILLGLKYSAGRTYPAMLAKFADCTYSHAVKVLDVLERHGVVEYQKGGRVKYVVLTEKGEELAFILEELYKKLKSFNK